MEFERGNMDSEKVEPKHFIQHEVEKDLAAGKNDGRIMTRFPPEPNGYLHIGHTKAICLNFELSKQYGGLCNLRLDDTNPVKEDSKYVEAIKRDIQWLGYDWDDRLYFTSDYFPKLYQYAINLIEKGLAYVCDLTAEEVREYRGTLTESGKNSPYRTRSVEENLALFEKMKNGEMEDGQSTLRAKIDMSSANMNMRDPAIYRVRKVPHHRSGDEWCIYPMYDFAHGLSDAIEGITHSLCSLEFENHRPLYDWFIDNIDVPHRPRQIEFARLNMTHTVMSKRKFLRLVEEGHVNGWDDPRMPTLAGMRKRGFSPSSIRDFCRRIGMAKADSTVDVAMFHSCVREELNREAHRYMAVLDPIKVVVTNYPENQEEMIRSKINQEDESLGKRDMPFSRELYIDREDFMLNPPKKYFRLAPGREVRFKYAYLLTCTDVIEDESGNVVQINCTYDPESVGGLAPDGRKVKGTIHWVSAKHCVDAELRLFDHLFAAENPEESDDFTQALNPDSLKVINAKVEPLLASLPPGERVQFERVGYFYTTEEHSEENPVFNRILALKDGWAKLKAKLGI